jgi:hypothetical protein
MPHKSAVGWAGIVSFRRATDMIFRHESFKDSGGKAGAKINLAQVALRRAFLLRALCLWL